MAEFWLSWVNFLNTGIPINCSTETKGKNSQHLDLVMVIGKTNALAIQSKPVTSANTENETQSPKSLLSTAYIKIVIYPPTFIRDHTKTYSVTCESETSYTNKQINTLQKRLTSNYDSGLICQCCLEKGYPS